MRRDGDLWPRVVDFRNLCDAAYDAARGKRTALGTARFIERVEIEALSLQRELESGEWCPRRGGRFEIHDPKTRMITAVPFRDQVVHHALINVLEPVLERRMIADSFACRRGKGTHAAVRRAQEFVRRYRFSLKLDVRAFFGSVRHDVALQAITRTVKDRRVIGLFATILRGPVEDVPTGVGLPIGSLTSQWLANLVLDGVDHHVKETLRVPGYLRYMDDMALFADDKDVLHAAHADIAEHLATEVRLELKPSATRLAPANEGLPFLGLLIFPGTTRLRPENRRRYEWRMRHRRWQFLRGHRSEASLLQSVASVFEHVKAADTLGLRRRWSAEEVLDI